MRLLAFATLTAVALVASGQRGQADEAFSLVINPFTGAAELRNDATEAVNLDGYFVASAADPILDSAGWNSLFDQGLDFEETSSPTGNRLGEVNLFGALEFDPGESVAIGSPYTPFSPAELGETEPGLGSIRFTYSTLEATQALTGDVEFEARNTLVLVVDPASGATSLVNQSSFDIDLDGYIISSNANVIDSVGWAPLADSDSGWTASTGATNRIAEGNLFGSTLLSPGDSLDLGAAIDPGMLTDETELSLDFNVAGFAEISGGVLFGEPSVPALDGDADGNFQVDGNDLLAVQSNFGDVGSPGLTGDADNNGQVDGNDLLAVQSNFGATASAATAVPEPSTIAVVLLAVTTLGATRRSAR